MSFIDVESLTLLDSVNLHSKTYLSLREDLTE